VHPLPWPSLLGLGLLGLFTWTLVEYLLHRYVFHLTEIREPWRNLASGLHMAHHHDPDVKGLIVAPPLVSVGFGTLLFFLFWAVTQSFTAASFLISGLFLGYVCYEWVHYAAHQYPLDSPLGRNWKKYHLQHHFKHPEAGFGVTSPLWDKIFGTYPHA
jgi:sterol desaturase/sphingolipid hydroxylase (fatty acid hydroxylase superfamily)